MPDIYEQHQTAFARVSAYVILHNGERVATVALKSPADGAGRLYAYVHWIGSRMVRGFAGGYGYDKRSAACANAAKRLPSFEDGEWCSPAREAWQNFRDALAKDSGDDWTRRLEKAGFTVLQAV